MSTLCLAGRIVTPLLILAVGQIAQAEPVPTIAPAPTWVREVAVPAPNPAGKELPLQILLSSMQHRIGPTTSEIYIQTVMTPQTTAGLQAIGNITVPWNSERSDLTIHHATLRRGKQIINLLTGEKLVVLRRENNLESSTLDGVRTVVLQAPGLQVGDIVDFAFTQRERPGTIGAKPEAIFAVVDPAPHGLIERRFLIEDAANVRWKTDPSLGELRRTKTGGTVELTYAKKDYVPAKVPENAPIRYRLPVIQLSSYASWQEVANVMRPLFDKARVPDPASPLFAEADAIAKSHATPEARMMAALGLTQEKVRYVSLALGEGTHIPATADQTWTRKFGDCKGKVAMLLALLDRLGIAAEPMLTSAAGSELIGDRLPSLYAFDHVVVRAHLGGRDFILDPTNYGQRTLEELSAPPFMWGLPLTTSAQLVRLPQTLPSMPLTETEILWDASKGFDQQVPYTATLTYRGVSAAFMRAIQASAPDRAELEKYLKNQMPRIDSDRLRIEAIDPDGKGGDFSVRFKGTAAMDWDRNVGGRRYYFDHSIPTWKPEFDRDSGLSKDLPVALVWPGWTRGTETITLPRDGNGFTLKAQPISAIVAGTEIKRSGSISAGRATIVAEFRRLTREISAQDARVARASLDRIAEDYAFATAPKDYVVSTAEVKSIISQDADGYDEYVDRARLLMDQRDRRRAIGELDKAIKIDAARAEAPALKAINYFLLDRQTEGRPELAKALSIDAGDGDVLRAQAMFAWYDRDSALALKAIDSAIESQPDFHGLYAIRANIRAGLGQYDDALVDVRRAVELSADTMSPGNIAQYEAASGRMDKAFATIDQAIAGGQDDVPYLLVMKGDLLAIHGKTDEAKATYRTAGEGMRARFKTQVAMSGGATPASSDLELQLLIATRNYHEAEPLADRRIARQRYPSSNSLAQRARIRAMIGKSDGAIDDARNAIDLDPTNEFARVSLILAYLRADKFGEAEGEATKALVEDRANAVLYYARAIARARLGNQPGSSDDMKAARQLQFYIVFDPAFLGLKPS